ncbi:hypothetical protein C0995_013827 [Termitomyces sp. Mi166|nr:hypothetical protein C0995_013827 [Termitomyces sp. Mi166\
MIDACDYMMQKSLLFLLPNAAATAAVILVHLILASHPDHVTFSVSLTEPLNVLDGLPKYDVGVASYTIDLKPLCLAIANITQNTTPSFLHISLSTLPPTKLRLVHGTTGAYDMLRLIQNVGIDAASCGVALSFVFSVPEDGDCVFGTVKDHANEEKKREIGHNLYNTLYHLSPLSDWFIPPSSSP